MTGDEGIARGRFDDPLPATGDGEAVTVLAAAPGFRVERIVSRGHRSPDGFWYDQDEHEWVMVTRGAAILAFEDGTRLTLGPGDWVDLPPHRRHRVEWTTPDEPTVWLAAFGHPPAGGDTKSSRVA